MTERLVTLAILGAGWATAWAALAVVERWDHLKAHRAAHEAAWQREQARRTLHLGGAGCVPCGCVAAGHPGTTAKGRGECPQCSGATWLPLVGWNMGAPHDQ